MTLTGRGIDSRFQRQPICVTSLSTCTGSESIFRSLLPPFVSAKVVIMNGKLINLAQVKSFKSQILAIAKKYGAHNVRIFGSVVYSQERPARDLDLLIELERGRTLLDIIAIKQDLEELLSCKVDVVTKDSISPYLRDSILKSAVNL